tara:strand:- start:50 stop:583 length:534 start_codon:yes stop_codon:yes gene_type:complete
LYFKPNKAVPLNKDILKSFIFFCLIIILSRLVPHPPNFTPIIAGAIFMPFMVKKSFGIGIPLAIMLVSDFIIGLHGLMLWTYGSLALITFFSYQYIKKKFISVFKVALASPIIFFLLTNFGVWLTSTSYSPDLAGLINSYTMGLPFLANSLISTILFSSCFYAIYYSLTSQSKLESN